MSLIFDEAAYKLTWELDHFEKFGLDWSYDLEIVDYPGYEKYAIFESEDFPHPNPVIFKGYPDIVKLLDFPYTDNSWRVLSRRMYDVLRGVSDFPHRALPTAVMDWRLQESAWFAGGRINPDAMIGEYITLQLTEHQDFFDRERSVFSPNPLFPNAIGDVDEYAFKIPPEGLPAIFTLKGDETRYFVSCEARIALKEAGIRGPAYISLKGYAKSGSDEIDVEIS